MKTLVVVGHEMAWREGAWAGGRGRGVPGCQGEVRQGDQGDR